MGRIVENENTLSAQDIEVMVGPVVIEPGEGDVPDPIFWSKACRQLGVPSEAQPFQKDGKEMMRARIPVMPKGTYDTVHQRAKFLLEREALGLPTEQLPSGRWPDSLDEFADKVPIMIAKDKEKGSVYIDFGRPIRAIGINPAMARTIATMIITAANEMDPTGEIGMRPELINIVRLQVPDKKVEQEGLVTLPGMFGGLKVLSEEQGIEECWKKWESDKGLHVGLCEVCSKPQSMSPGGVVCENGHGGAGTLNPCWACVSYLGNDKCAEPPKGPGRDPGQNIDDSCSDWGINLQVVALEVSDE